MTGNATVNPVLRREIAAKQSVRLLYLLGPRGSRPRRGTPFARVTRQRSSASRWSATRTGLRPGAARAVVPDAREGQGVPGSATVRPWRRRWLADAELIGDVEPRRACVTVSGLSSSASQNQQRGGADERPRGRHVVARPSSGSARYSAPASSRCSARRAPSRARPCGISSSSGGFVATLLGYVCVKLGARGLTRAICPYLVEGFGNGRARWASHRWLGYIAVTITIAAM